MTRIRNHQGFFLLKLSLTVLLALTPVAALAQGADNVYENPEGYSLKLPPNWLAVVSKDGLGRDDVVIVYKSVREDGALKVRRISVEPGTNAMDAAKREEDQTLRFRPGYSRGAVENFAAGYKSAALISYDYTQAGRPKMGRNYYIQVNETTVYALWFTGNRNTLGPLRAQTDAIARSFRAK